MAFGGSQGRPGLTWTKGVTSGRSGDCRKKDREALQVRKSGDARRCGCWEAFRLYVARVEGIRAVVFSFPLPCSESIGCLTNAKKSVARG